MEHIKHLKLLHIRTDSLACMYFKYPNIKLFLLTDKLVTVFKVLLFTHISVMCRYNA